MGNVGSVLTHLVPNAIWIGFVAYLITHPEVAEKWGAIFYSIFSNISKGAEKRTVALDIQGRLDSFSKSLNSEVPGAMPNGVKVEWVTGKTTRESFFRDNQVIIRMDYHANQDDNIVRAALEYIAKGLLPDSRPYVDEDVMTSVDLISTKKLIEKERKSALQYYYAEVLGPARRSNAELDRFVVVVNRLDELGYFSRLLLRELQGIGLKKQFSIPKQGTKDETKRFLDFLDQKLVKKEPGVDVDPTFVSESVSVSIVYVAKGEIIGPHLAWINRCVKRRIASIYICARGAYNIALVRRLQNRLKSSNKVTEVFCEEFVTPSLGSRKKDNICTRYDIRSEETA